MAWLRTTWMPYTSRLPEGRRTRFLQEIAGAYAREYPANERGELVVPMVRLEVEAVKVSGASEPGSESELGSGSEPGPGSEPGSGPAAAGG